MMRHHWKKIVQWSCLLLAALLFAIAYYLRQSHPLAASSSIADLQEALRWFQIADNLALLAVGFGALPFLWRFIAFLKEEYRKENALHK